MAEIDELLLRRQIDNERKWNQEIAFRLQRLAKLGDFYSFENYAKRVHAIGKTLGNSLWQQTFQSVAVHFHTQRDFDSMNKTLDLGSQLFGESFSKPFVLISGLVENGNFSAAIGTFKKLKEKEPFLAFDAMTYVLTSMLDNILEEMKQKNIPEGPYTQSHLFQMAIKEKNLVKALAVFVRMEGNTTEYGTSFFMLCLELRDCAMLWKFIEVIGIQGFSWKRIALMMNLFFSEGQYDLALETFNQKKSTDPHWVTAQICCDLAIKSIGQLKGKTTAQDAMDIFLHMPDPKYRVLISLAQTLVNFGDIQLCSKLLVKTKTRRPPNSMTDLCNVMLRHALHIHTSSVAKQTIQDLLPLFEKHSIARDTETENLIRLCNQES